MMLDTTGNFNDFPAFCSNVLSSNLKLLEKLKLCPSLPPPPSSLLIFIYVLVGRPEGKRPLGRPRRKWEDNIKIDPREIGIDGANWIQLAQDSVQ
jgi:hypothetical protein